MQSRDKNNLIRFTVSCDSFVPDNIKKQNGRGFYLCKSRDCMENAIKKKAFNRMCRSNVDNEYIRKIVIEQIEQPGRDVDVEKS